MTGAIGPCVTDGMRELLAQRIYDRCCGWEGVCDYNLLQRDLALQTAVDRADDLVSAPTPGRLETSSTRARAAALHGVLLGQFIAGKGKRPCELVLGIAPAAANYTRTDCTALWALVLKLQLRVDFWAS